MKELRWQLSKKGSAAAVPTVPRRRSPARPKAEGGGSIQSLAGFAPADPALLERMKASTPAKVAVGRAGLRYRTETLLQFAADFAVAQAAVESQVPEGWAEQQGWISLKTRCADAEEFLARPDLGRRLSPESEATIAQQLQRDVDVQIVVGDGLSASAVLQNAPDMVSTMLHELQARGLRAGRPVFVRHCRSRIVDYVGQAVQAKVGIILLGERPGLGTGDGMSAYLVWDPSPERTDAEKQAISNVHRRGLLPGDAGGHAVNIIQAIMTQRTSGVNLDLSSVPIPSHERKRENQANPAAPMGCGQSHGQQCSEGRDGLPGKECRRTNGRPCEVCRR